MFKNCAPFLECITEINNTPIDNAKDIDVAMPMYKCTVIIIQKHEEVYGNVIDDNITQFKLFISKTKITGNTPANGNTKDVKIVVPLKYLSNFWKTPEMPLVNCELLSC